jgi:AcrR family transcriptional regulator
MHTGKFDGEPIPPETGLPAAIAARLPMLLLDAAETRFLAQGYETTSVEQIAADVGATRCTIYAKFGDKAGLFSALVLQFETEVHSL